MQTEATASRTDQIAATSLSTFSFAICIAVWLLFSIIGVPIKEELALSDTQFGLLIATPILTGSLSRIVLGMLTEIYGGRLVLPVQMLLTAVAVWFLPTISSYEGFLVAALGVGLAGGAFSIGVPYVSAFFDQSRQGTALGIFGAGNVGSALTSFLAPVMVGLMGWQTTAQIYAVVLAAVGVLFFVLAPTDPAHRPGAGRKKTSIVKLMAPLRYLQVWRFSTYYFFVYGGFIALAAFLPRYYMGAYELSLSMAGVLTGCFALPGSLFRAYGGVLADKIGARTVMYAAFLVSLVCLFLLSYPPTRYEVAGINGPVTFEIVAPLWGFVGATVVLGFFMSLGQAAVFKHIPVYYPHHVGPIGGLVGMIGGLGGFFLPVAFGVLLDVFGVWTVPFMVMFAIVGISTVWMHLAIRRMERRRHPELRDETFLSDVPDRPFPANGGDNGGDNGSTASEPRESVTPSRE